MRFADEVVPAADLEEVTPEDGKKLDKREVEMAKQLIDSLASDFEAQRYKDEYREELLALIERKAKGEAIVTQPSEEPKPTKAPDLMAALEESLAAVRGEELAGEQAGEGDGAKPKRRAKSTSKGKGSKSKTKSKSSSASRSGGRRKTTAKS
jgi:DNA end-binding protein Ku